MATLKIADKTIKFNVNPKGVTLEKSTNSTTSDTNRSAAKSTSGSGGITASNVGLTQYKGTKAALLRVAGAVLGSGDGVTDISSDLDLLYSALVPPVGDDSKSLPPKCIFTWGTWTPLANAFLQDLKININDWLPSGKPVRADITTLVLREASTDDPGQNPTSGAYGSRRTHTVIAGDSLASISYNVYGRPDFWRAIADVNGIDDPLRLRTGSELLIPPREYAKGHK
jgi:nucleoid-associated protein YgaU